MAPPLPFTKYQSAGNDFILIDARNAATRAIVLSLAATRISKICHRKFGIGADGFILLLSHPDYDFEMKNYNPDGGECSMCGNGARALVHFARQVGISKSHYRFLASDGEHEARIDSTIQVKMSDVKAGVLTPLGMTFDTGSPHLVRKVSGLEDYPVTTEGAKIRHSPLFSPSGINANFIEEIAGQLFIRTFERGVEDETLSCGTGAIAAALAYGQDSRENSVQSQGGPLKVTFERDGPDFKNIWLVGPTEITFTGIINMENS